MVIEGKSLFEREIEEETYSRIAPPCKSKELGHARRIWLQKPRLAITGRSAKWELTMPATPLMITADVAGRVLLLKAIGHVDAATGKQLRSVLITAIDEPHRRRIVADLREVSRIDKAGVAALIQSRNYAAWRGVALHFLVDEGSIVDQALSDGHMQTYLNVIHEINGITAAV